MSANDPAFPRSIASIGGDYKSMSIAAGFGLTKREYFAAMALQGILSAVVPGWKPGDVSLAEVAVKQADALIAALEGK